MYTWEKTTTIEKLEMENTTVIVYDNTVIAIKELYDYENIRQSFYCALYDFRGTYNIENEIRYVTSCSNGFKDNGHAVEWGLNQLTELYDDPIELLMNYTEPHMNFTLAEMEKFISQAIEEGWRCPPDWEPQDFLDVYNDLETNDEEK